MIHSFVLILGFNFLNYLTYFFVHLLFFIILNLFFLTSWSSSLFQAKLLCFHSSINHTVQLINQIRYLFLQSIAWVCQCKSAVVAQHLCDFLYLPRTLLAFFHFQERLTECLKNQWNLTHFQKTVLCCSRCQNLFLYPYQSHLCLLADSQIVFFAVGSQFLCDFIDLFVRFVLKHFL